MPQGSFIDAISHTYARPFLRACWLYASRLLLRATPTSRHTFLFLSLLGRVLYTEAIYAACKREAGRRCALIFLTPLLEFLSRPVSCGQYFSTSCARLPVLVAASLAS